jgi:hypothetical protein
MFRSFFLARVFVCVYVQGVAASFNFLVPDGFGFSSACSQASLRIGDSVY